LRQRLEFDETFLNSDDVLQNNQQTSSWSITHIAWIGGKNYGIRRVMYNWFVSNSKLRPEIFCLRSTQYARHLSSSRVTQI